jgi:hypothetical protein
MFIVFIYGKNDILDQIIIQMQIVKTPVILFYFIF